VDALMRASGGTLLWSSRAGDGSDISTTIVWSSPAMNGTLGLVYIGSRDGHLYAFDEGSGQQRFNATTFGYVDSSPRLSGDMVVIGCSGNKSVCAFDSLDGALVWRTTLSTSTENGLVDSSPAISPDGATVASADDDGSISLLDAARGDLLWRSPPEHTSPEFGFEYSSFASPSFTASGDTIFAASGGLDLSGYGTGNGSVFSLSTLDGQRRWTYTLDAINGSVQSSPSLTPDEAAVVFGSWDGSIYKLSALDGSLLWKMSTGGRVDANARFSPDNATMYMGSWDYCLYALEVATGALKWKSCTDGVVRSSAAPSSEGSAVLVGSADGFLYCFDAAEGSIRWKAYCGKSDHEYGVRSTPLLSSDEAAVFVGSGDGRLYAFATGFGSRPADRWTTRNILSSAVGGDTVFLALLVTVCAVLRCWRYDAKGSTDEALLDNPVSNSRLPERKALP